MIRTLLLAGAFAIGVGFAAQGTLPAGIHHPVQVARSEGGAPEQGGPKPQFSYLQAQPGDVQATLLARSEGGAPEQGGPKPQFAGYVPAGGKLILADAKNGLYHPGTILTD